MTRLIGLYPRAWRTATRTSSSPCSPSGRRIRSIASTSCAAPIDARLHPQVERARRSRPSRRSFDGPWPVRAGWLTLARRRPLDRGVVVVVNQRTDRRRMAGPTAIRHRGHAVVLRSRSCCSGSGLIARRRSSCRRRRAPRAARTSSARLAGLLWALAPWFLLAGLVAFGGLLIVAVAAWRAGRWSLVELGDPGRRRRATRDGSRSWPSCRSVDTVARQTPTSSSWSSVPRRGLVRRRHLARARASPARRATADRPPDRSAVARHVVPHASAGTADRAGDPRARGPHRRRGSRAARSSAAGSPPGSACWPSSGWPGRSGSPGRRSPRRTPRVRVGTFADLLAANPGLPIREGFPAYVAGGPRLRHRCVDPARGGWQPGTDPTGDGTALNVRALSQVCPHLGCRPNPCIEDFWFHCPCHQSRYDRLGIKAAGERYGPAPRGMDRYAIEVDASGVLTIDTGQRDPRAAAGRPRPARDHPAARRERLHMRSARSSASTRGRGAHGTARRCARCSECAAPGRRDVRRPAPRRARRLAASGRAVAGAGDRGAHRRRPVDGRRRGRRSASPSRRTGPATWPRSCWWRWPRPPCCSSRRSAARSGPATAAAARCGSDRRSRSSGTSPGSPRWRSRPPVRPTAATLAAAQTLAMIGATLVGVVLVRAGDWPIGLPHGRRIGGDARAMDRRLARVRGDVDRGRRPARRDVEPRPDDRRSAGLTPSGAAMSVAAVLSRPPDPRRDPARSSTPDRAAGRAPRRRGRARGRARGSSGPSAWASFASFAASS